MVSFLKVFARGVICTVLLPVILVVWVLYGAYCLVAFVIVFIKNVILFFTGENPTGDLKEDIEAKRILLEKEQAQVEQAQVMSMMYQNMASQFAQPQRAPQPANNDFDPFSPDPVEEPVPTKKSNEGSEVNEGE